MNNPSIRSTTTHSFSGVVPLNQGDLTATIKKITGLVSQRLRKSTPGHLFLLSLKTGARESTVQLPPPRIVLNDVSPVPPSPNGSANISQRIQLSPAPTTPMESSLHQETWSSLCIQLGKNIRGPLLASTAVPTSHRAAWNKLKSRAEQMKYCSLRALAANPTDGIAWSALATNLFIEAKVTVTTDELPESHRAGWGKLANRAEQLKYCSLRALAVFPKAGIMWANLAEVLKHFSEITVTTDELPESHRASWGKLANRAEQLKYCYLRCLAAGDKSGIAWAELGFLVAFDNLDVSAKELPGRVPILWGRMTTQEQKSLFCIKMGLRLNPKHVRSWFILELIISRKNYGVGVGILPESHRSKWPVGDIDAQQRYCRQMVKEVVSKFSDIQKRQFHEYSNLLYSVKPLTTSGVQRKRKTPQQSALPPKKRTKLTTPRRAE